MKIQHEIKKTLLKGTSNTYNNVCISYKPYTKDTAILIMHTANIPDNHTVYVNKKAALELSQFYADLAEILGD